MTTLKKLLRKSMIATAILFVSAQPVYASAVTDQILMQIRDTTYSVLDTLNRLPVYLEAITQMAQSWVTTDDPNNIIANSQYSYTMITISNQLTKANQLSMSLDLTNKFLLAGSTDPNNPALPSNANELNYGILYGQILPNTQTPDDMDGTAKNYVANLTGANIQLRQASPGWKPTQASANYQSFYNLIAATKSYTAYVLSSAYKQQDAETSNNTLMEQAGNPTWFQQISTEPLGLVLRQLLMYNSQIYIQLTRLIKLQQDALQLQAATTNLLGLSVQQFTGDQLWMKAQQSR